MLVNVLLMPLTVVNAVAAGGDRHRGRAAGVDERVATVEAGAAIDGVSAKARPDAVAAAAAGDHIVAIAKDDVERCGIRRDEATGVDGVVEIAVAEG